MTDSDLLHTPLNALHRELGGKMVPFAGYEMPVQYEQGVKREHLHTRAAAGLFDVSHMGQVLLHGDQAAKALETLVPVDICDLPEGQQRYALFTNEQGGILDDLMVSNLGDKLLLVVNAACKRSDVARLQAQMPAEVAVEELTEQALVALQGPAAVLALSRLNPEVADLVFMDSRVITLVGVDCIVSRAGYTGEDGFEISIPADRVESLARELLAMPEVAPIGLGARDSLRLEAGLCLYGHDITAETTPVEASLLWAISKVRRSGGARAGGFPGADVVMDQLTNKDYHRKRVGLLGHSRAPIREGTILVGTRGEPIGQVTSGSFGPTASAAIAMAYIDAEYATLDTEVGAKVRGKTLPMTVTKMPFVPQRYYRG